MSRGIFEVAIFAGRDCLQSGHAKSDYSPPASGYAG
jgi:hypothetical protein